jgi:hypothetical protein
LNINVINKVFTIVVLSHAIVLFAFVASVIAIVSAVLSLILGIAFWKVAAIVAGTVIATKLAD